MLFVTRLILVALLACAPCVANPRDSPKRQPAAIERRIHINPPGVNDSRYFYVPFTVPEDAARISVIYQYDRAKDTNTIDIGLFDARGTGVDTDPTGFRGWSGGRRSEFFIARDEATPGYMPGELPPGTWRVILGLYRVAPAGVDVVLKITIEQESRSYGPIGSLAQPRSALLKGRTTDGTHAPSPRWWSGDLHLHTVHSDGDWTIADLISTARNSGLDFICITDHNTASHHSELDRAVDTAPPLVLRGEEITTYGGHTNAWGLPSGTWIDFRAHPGDIARIGDIAAQAHRAGALISINHPFALCGGCAWSYDKTAAGFDAIEVWNGAWEQVDDEAVAMWDRILQSGRRITAVGSSDSHRATTPIGQPTTHVLAAMLSQESLLEAIRRGRVYVASEAAQPIVSFEAQTTGKGAGHFVIGDEIHLPGPRVIRFLVTTNAAPADVTVSLISNGKVIREFASDARRTQITEIECRANAYFRIEVRDRKNVMLALTNPIFVRLA